VNHLLLLSDNIVKTQILKQDLIEGGFQVDLIEESELDQAQNYHLVIIDIYHDFEYVKTCIKHLQQFPHILILIIGPDASLHYCLDTFELGADDYLKRPFANAECFARIKALLKRSHLAPNTDSQLNIGPIQLNCLTRHASLNHEPLHLTNSEFNLLELFLRYPGRVLSKEMLTEYSLGRKYTLYDRSIDVHVSNLRHKINQYALNEGMIETVRGYGYTFVAKG
jgi:two-component system, OmpR family, response regulator CpxR